MEKSLAHDLDHIRAVRLPQKIGVRFRRNFVDTERRPYHLAKTPTTNAKIGGDKRNNFENHKIQVNWPELRTSRLELGRVSASYCVHQNRPQVREVVVSARRRRGRETKTWARDEVVSARRGREC
jgi:hypothetical protein